jgi:chromodomain-helicase-DNA-binding protein 4
MTTMLDIIEDYLDHHKISCCRLDGTTPANLRQSSIDKFNAPDSSVMCFLLSTRAGGLGINLATADTIIMYDADWNPHMDIQAYARAHRYGQTRKVMVYKLVCLDTIDEAIISKTKHKLVLDHAIMSSSAAKIKPEELHELLQFGAKVCANCGNDFFP